MIATQEIAASAVRVPYVGPPERGKPSAVRRYARLRQLRMSRRWNGGVPETVLLAMWEEYLRCGSCTMVARLFGGTGHAAHALFVRRGLLAGSKHF